MVIIFDSADKCGKTEMATALSKALNVPYFKNKQEWQAFGKDPNYFVNALRYGDTYFYNFLKDTGTSIILDRSYPSEWVYSKVYGRSTDEDVLRYVDELAFLAGARIIIPYRTSYAGRRDDVHDIDEVHLQKLSDVYAEFAAWTKCPTLRFCVDNEDLNEELHTILNFLRGGNK